MVATEAQQHAARAEAPDLPSGPLDVLVVESLPRAAAAAAEALTAAGHTVHRCYDDGVPGFPCYAVAGPGACPLDHHVDVALVVRRRVDPRPTVFERGVACALRAGVPVVEQGPDLLDPFAPWIEQRLTDRDDVVDACRRAAAHHRNR